MPNNLGDLLAGYEKVLIPELNTGQLITMLRAEFLVPAKGLNKVNGQPFKIREQLTCNAHLAPALSFKISGPPCPFADPCGGRILDAEAAVTDARNCAPPGSGEPGAPCNDHDDCITDLCFAGQCIDLPYPLP